MTAPRAVYRGEFGTLHVGPTKPVEFGFLRSDIFEVRSTGALLPDACYAVSVADISPPFGGYNSQCEHCRLNQSHTINLHYRAQGKS